MEEIGMLNALQLATPLGIKAPGIKRTIKIAENVYVVMERIHGQTLDEACVHLRWFTTLQLAFQATPVYPQNESPNINYCWIPLQRSMHISLDRRFLWAPFTRKPRIHHKLYPLLAQFRSAITM
ncbi:hypothetical protein I7I50_03613 [Histoplasma capsulatum G186AR]|uniref:Uncharacterized protein n=1 Tax=Ajellomyces capsulatus TaxID=5037 RepID=A0A8H7YJ08_AJECA|nr:hypothetical protein I7I52_04520 [Histoplasma capsulatum]QSS74710.1 hypothetical protein I7I50_03613 [Histoplasma capsulatum G186AR]